MRWQPIFLKISGPLQRQRLPRAGVRKGQVAGVQQQPRGQGLRLWGCIQRITQDGVTHGRHVHAQLVRAAGDGFQFDA